MSERRQARRSGGTITTTRDDGIPVDLAAGPCVEVWADPDAQCPTWSARKNWRDARDLWAEAQGLRLPEDYRHLPRALCDRAPF